jgi:putative salt-induced outer membrane protein
MNKAVKLASVSALALLVAAPAFAQAALIGTEALDERIDDISSDVREDLARGEDDERFGPMGVVQGWRGSVALSASAASGNTDSGELSVAGRLNYGVGVWNHSFGFASEYGEANGVKSEEKFFAIYEGSRYFTPELYAFGVARVEYDGFATNERDAFLGFGPGYRIINTPDMAWRVQAGPGIRYIEDQLGASDTEAGFIASSRFFYGISETVSLTNDTDALGSDANTIVTNDFGVNYKMTDSLSTRISYRTEYNTDPLPGFKSTDNTIGIALIVGF